MVGGVGGGLDFNRIKLMDAKNKKIYIAPIDTKIKKNEKRIKLFSAIEGLANNMGKVVKDLSRADTYRQVNTHNSDKTIATISPKAGAKVQNFSLEVKQLATESIIQSLNYNKKSDTVSKGDGSVDISMGKSKFTIKVSKTTTLLDVVELINKNSKGAVKASIFKTAKGNYRLMLKGKDTGAKNAVKIVESPLVDLRLGSVLEQNNLQKAHDAIFMFSGTEMRRDKNHFHDLIDNVDITLHDEGKTRVSLTQNVKNITTEVKTFAKLYNDLTKSVDKVTLYDSKTKKIAPLFDLSILRDMTGGLFNVINREYNKNTVLNYGFSFDKEGKLNIDYTKFERKLRESVEGTEKFFFGTKYDYNKPNIKAKDGVFTATNKFLDRYLKSKGQFNIESANMHKEGSRLEDDKTKTLDRLEKKHKLMLNQFIHYDEVIAKMNSSLNSLRK